MRPVTVHQARHGLIWGAVPMPDGSAGTGPAEAFTAPDPLETSKYQSAFGVAGTPLAAAVAATVAWYRTRPSTP
jgi:hypothetical protein